MSEDQLLDNRKIIEAAKEARYLIQFNQTNENRVVIYASKAPTKRVIDMRYAFKVEIVREPKEKYIQWLVENILKIKEHIFFFSLSLDDDTETLLWRINIAPPVDFDRFVAQRYIQILQQYHTRSMRAKEFLEYFRRTTFSEEKVMRNFEKVKVDTCVHVSISKEWPIKLVTIRGDDSQSPVVASQWETLPGYCYAPFTSLNYENLLNLKTSRICVSIEQLTARNIAHFIVLWKNGAIGDNLEFAVWKDHSGRFDVGTLGTLMEKNLEGGDTALINHSIVEGRIGRLYYKSGELRFFVDNHYVGVL